MKFPASPKILLLTQWFDPGPTSKGLVFARALQERGYAVEVLTGFPNYPGGKVYPGYQLRTYQREAHDGVIVHRVPLYPSHDGSGVRRVFNYASFAAASLGALLTLSPLGMVAKPDLIYVYHPPLTTGLVATLHKVFTGVPFVVDIQDLWPDTLAATGMLTSPPVLDAVGSLCDLVYRAATRVVVLSPGFRARLLARGVPAEKLKVIYNWCDEKNLARFRGRPRRELLGEHTNNFRVLFAGNLGKAQALEAVVAAARRLHDQQAVNSRRAEVVFLGNGLEKENVQRLARELPNVSFLPPVPMSEVGEYLAAADLLLVHLRNDPLFEITIPSKTQAYLAAGRPLLMAVRGDAADLAVRSGGALSAEPENPVSIADAISECMQYSPGELERLGAAGRAYYESELSVAAGVGHFDTLFREMLRQNSNHLS